MNLTDMSAMSRSTSRLPAMVSRQPPPFRLVVTSTTDASSEADHGRPAPGSVRLPPEIGNRRGGPTRSRPTPMGRAVGACMNAPRSAP